MTIDLALQLIVTGALILGSTWKLSSQIAAIETKLDRHIQADGERFADIENDLNRIAPRVVNLRQAAE